MTRNPNDRLLPGRSIHLSPSTSVAAEMRSLRSMLFQHQARANKAEQVLLDAVDLVRDLVDYIRTRDDARLALLLARANAITKDYPPR